MEIVGPWWNDLLPIVAIVLSLGTLIWTIWDKNRSLARVTAKTDGLSWPYLDEADANGSKGFVNIAVKNEGRVDSTVISSIIMEIPMEKSKRPIMLVQPATSSHDLPQKIEPGATFVFGFDLEQIARATRGDMSYLKRIRCKVRSGHGDVNLPLQRDTREYIAHFAPEWKAAEM
ncbi:hypothetical protein CXX84_01040 [Arthrobacter sp. AFG7.2]|nr:hypothetical protein CXX84_01040 [Arthrobacter sp. AFG7.2]